MLYFFVIITNFINARISKHSTVIPIIGMAILTFLAANAGVLGSVDYGTYSRGYTSLAYSDTNQFEWGYTLLEKMSIAMNLDYDQFRMVIFSISFFILFVAIKKFTDNVADFVWLFAIFPFINEANQVRNFAMLSFGILAMSCYVTSQKLLVPFLLIIIAASFHSLGYLFILVILISQKVSRVSMKSLTITGGIGLIFSLILLLFSNSVGIIGKIITQMFLFLGRSDGTNISEIYAAYGSGTTSSTKIILTFMIIFLLIMIYFAILSNEFTNYVSKQRKTLIISVFVMSLIGIIMLTASVQNQRILRNGITLLLVLHSFLNGINIENLDNNKKKLGILRNIVIIFIMLISINTFDGGYFSEKSMIQPTIGYLLKFQNQ